MRRASNRKLQLTTLNGKVQELELTAIRAQMNPHFMYNCLNSIQNLVQKNKSDEAHLYISKFASMIRRVLKNSDREEIALAEELEMIREYVLLEQLRFGFKFTVDIQPEIDVYSLFIPPLLLQPLIENAIVHGLAGKQGEKELRLSVYQKEDNTCVSIIDNGIGLNATSGKIKNSTGKGLHFSKERLKLLSEKFDTKYCLQIRDRKAINPTHEGTEVEICFQEDE